ncbi:MAG: MlaD family protein [Verrucomicrobiota bacterium]
MKNKSDAIIALSVIACALVLLGALFFSVSGNPFKEPHLRFSVDFEDLTGIQRTSAVLYAGDEVGYVDQVEHLSVDDRLTDEGVIRAHLVIEKEVSLPMNMNAMIGSASLLGEKHIALQRRDDEGGVLVAGAKLSAGKAGTLLDTLVPGANSIVANIQSITEELKDLTEGLGEGPLRDDLERTFSNSRTFTEDLNTLVTGEVEAIELHQMLVELVSSLNQAGGSINELVAGSEEDPESGLNARSQVILANLEEFSHELNEAIAGAPGGAPGLRQELEEITGEIHDIVIGGRGSRDGLQVKIDRVANDINSLMAEVQTLIVWSEYVAGTLAGKPSRLLWGSKPNEVPSKEEILEHFRSTNEPFPVRIREIEEGSETENEPSSGSPRNGILIPRANRE